MLVTPFIIFAKLCNISFDYLHFLGFIPHKNVHQDNKYAGFVHCFSPSTLKIKQLEIMNSNKHLKNKERSKEGEGE